MSAAATSPNTQHLLDAVARIEQKIDALDKKVDCITTTQAVDGNRLSTAEKEIDKLRNENRFIAFLNAAATAIVAAVGIPPR